MTLATEADLTLDIHVPTRVAQWRLETLRFVNWGGFHGSHTFDVHARATMLSGKSGTGKSTLFDAWSALTTDFKTAFNAASNDATTGRARSGDQRNVPSYLRGKRDVTFSESGELVDRVLRGENTSTWGAVGATFIADNGERFSALRLYFLPRGRKNPGDEKMVMCTIDGPIDLAAFDQAAQEQFDRARLRSLFPGIKIHDQYTTGFLPALSARLGLGDDPGRTIRLLARIQASKQIVSVDELYKDLVIETPRTYEAADAAIDEFGRLEAIYDAMVIAAEKEEQLRPIAGWYAEYEQARDEVGIIATIGADHNRTGFTPLGLWAGARELALLAVDRGAAEHELAEAQVARDEAAVRKQRLAEELTEVRQAQYAAGGGELEMLDNSIDAAGAALRVAERAYDQLVSATSALDIALSSRPAYDKAAELAGAFMADYEAVKKQIEARRQVIGDEGAPLRARRRELGDERESLRGRDGQVPRHLHDARVAAATAAGLDPADLPFVAELIDVHPDQTHWRTAIETTLGGIARIMLIDATHLARLSRAVDSLRADARIQFEGVALSPFVQKPANASMVSGKLVHKDSPFSDWVQKRVARDDIDHRCVDGPDDLGGAGRQVTRNGQTRHGQSGAFGGRITPIIGFNSTLRVAQIEEELLEIADRLADVDRRDELVRNERDDLEQRKGAHLAVLAARWDDIDIATHQAKVDDLTHRRDKLVAASTQLAALKARETELHDQELAAAVAAENAKTRITDAGDRIARGETRVAAIAADAEAAGRAGIRCTDEQAAFIAARFADETSLDTLERDIQALGNQFVAEAEAKNKIASSKAEQLTGRFKQFNDRWNDPDRGVTINSYRDYADEYERILAEGLHDAQADFDRRIIQWSSEDLVLLAGRFDEAFDDIETRLAPVNEILASLPFGAGKDRLSINVRRLNKPDHIAFLKELRQLASGITGDQATTNTKHLFNRIRRFMVGIRKPEIGVRVDGPSRDERLDVRRHVAVSATIRDVTSGDTKAHFEKLAEKSGGESQELVSFILAAALRYQLGDIDAELPRFAPVFLDEGFVKADSEFGGRAVAAFLGLGFQLIVATPNDKCAGLEPHMDLLYQVTKDTDTGYSFLTAIRPLDPPAT